MSDANPTSIASEYQRFALGVATLALIMNALAAMWAVSYA